MALSFTANPQPSALGFATKQATTFISFSANQTGLAFATKPNTLGLAFSPHTPTLAFASNKQVRGLAFSPNAETLIFVHGLRGATGATGSGGGGGQIRIVTASGAVTVDAVTDDVIVLLKSVPATTTVSLPSAADRTSPVTIKDGNGDCDTYNITIDANGSETIDGDLTVTIDSPFASVTLYPYPNGLGWFAT